MSKKKKNNTPVNNTVIPDQHPPTTKPEEVADNTSHKKNGSSFNVAKRHDLKEEKKKEQPEELKKEENVIGKNDDGKQPSNNLAKPDHNPNVVEDRDSEAVAKIEDKISPEILTPRKENVGEDVVTTSNLNPSDLKEQSGKNNKGIRGFLRKVTRTFEKRTNIKATDDDDRLLIAGLAIKLN